MAGRGKKTIIPEAQIKEAEQLVLDTNCKNNTVAEIMGWPKDVITRHTEIADRLAKKRAEYAIELYKAQKSTAIDAKNPVMQIFLGKNYLGQADKQEVGISGNLSLLPPIVQKTT